MICLFDDLSSYTDARFHADLDLLPPSRREKALRYRDPEDGKRSALAFLLLRDALRTEYGILDVPEFRTNEYGKPYFEDLPVHFNISHCRDAVAVIVADHPVGIDVESIAPYRPHAARMIACDEELLRIENASDPARAFIRLWTEKEAIVKYEGCGLSHACKDLDPAEYDLHTEESPDGRYILTACYGKKSPSSALSPASRELSRRESLEGCLPVTPYR